MPADHCRVEAGAASDEDHPPDLPYLRLGEGELVQDYLASLEVDAASQGSGHGLGLLHDLLEHEVPVARFLGPCCALRHRLRALIYVLVIGPDEPYSVFPHHRGLTVVQEGDAVGEGEQGRHVAADRGLARVVGEHDAPGVAESGGHQGLLPASIHGGYDGLGAEEMFLHGQERRFKAQPLVQALLYEVCDDLAVGFRGEGMATGLQALPELEVVLHDAVVDDGYASLAVGMGVGVGVGRPAVGRPAGVSETQVPLRSGLSAGLGQLADLARRLVDLQPAAGGEDGDTGAVVAPVLQAPQAVQHGGPGVARAEVAYDPTHIAS